MRAVTSGRLYISAVLLSSAAVMLSQAASVKKLQFNGSPTADPKLGYLVAASKEKDSVIIANTNSGFIVAIPFAESWKLELEGDRLLRGESERFLVTVKLVPGTNRQASEELEAKRAGLKEDKAWTIEEDTLLTVEGVPILRYRIIFTHVPKELEKVNDWQWQYWASVPANGRWASVHVSLLQSGASLNEGDDRQVIKALSTSFASTK